MTNQPKQVTNNNSYGISFLGLLGILFIGLKLTGYVSWSWALVLLPIYLPFALGLTVFTLGGVILLACAMWEKRMLKAQRAKRIRK